MGKYGNYFNELIGQPPDGEAYILIDPIMRIIYIMLNYVANEN